MSSAARIARTDMCSPTARRRQDVEAVHLAPRERLAHARSGEGPVFLLCETERLTGRYIGDAQVYRDKEESRRLRETRDPVRNLRESLELTDEKRDRLHAEAHEIVDAAVEFAKAGTDPDPADALENVHAVERAIPSPRIPERRE
jgi:pyruvate dehydrogenase E1 component alpha subunit